MSNKERIVIRYGGKRMGRSLVYEVVKSIGTFADESGFKEAYMNIIKKDKERFKTVIAIENSVEPGMPDLIVVDAFERSTFVETKYAKKGVITFKRTQIPWYMRNRNLPIFVVAYNDLTENVHIINATCVLAKANGLTVRLEKDDNFVIKETI